MAIVRFHNADVRSVALKDKREVKIQIAEIFKAEDKNLAQLDYIFCSDPYLLEMNKSFLSHDTYTDVITFDLSENDGIRGEVYVSTDRVKENSVIHQTSFSSELLRVMFHGALHLCGYNDKKKSEITVMRHKEDHYLQIFNEKKRT